jgi:[ribosomal protein S5]-alanine N-acetyltransferase
MAMALLSPTLTTRNEAALAARLDAALPTTAWQTGLPVLHTERATLRELRVSDAASLLACLSTEEVIRFISPPPTTAEGFERFIAWTEREQAAGRYICFGIVPDGCAEPVGIIQLRQLEPGFGVAEWGFALGSAFWGTGLFQEAAKAVIAFAFDRVGIQRIEARAAVTNGRGNGALQKIGAIREGLLRRSFLKDGIHLDQALWGIVSSEWRSFGAPAPPRVH